MTATETETYVPTFDLSTVPEKDRQRVSDLIPNPLVAQLYVHRNVHGIEDFAILDKAMERKKNIILAGPTGSAKTTLFRAYAAARGLPFALVECNAAMDPGTVVGRTTIDPETGQPVWVDGEWTLVVRYGGVGLVDEINMLHPRLTASFFQLLAVTRRMSIPEHNETVQAGKGGMGEPQPTLFGAAYNPRYQGTMRLNEALANRFALPIDWGYERSVEEQLIESPRLLDMAENMRSLSEIRTPISTNMLQEFVEHFYDFGMAGAIGFFVAHFPPEERNPIERAFEANAEAIEQELS